MEKKKNIGCSLILLVVFVFWIIIGINTPVMGDDWEISTWHSRGGLEFTMWGMIKSWSTYTGRIMNNFFDAVITHYRSLWIVLSAIIHTAIIWLIAKLYKKQKCSLFLFFIFVTTISIGNNIRNEIQLYAICNVSYAICTFTIFLYYYLSINNFSLFESKILNEIFWGVYALFNCLWIENLTVGFDVLILILFLRKVLHRAQSNVTLGGEIGTIIGNVILFSSVGISNRVDKESTIFSTISANLKPLLNDLIIDNLLLYFIFCVVIILYLLGKKKREKIWYFSITMNIISISLIVIKHLSDMRRDILYIERNPFWDSGKYIYILAVVILTNIFISCFNSKYSRELILLYSVAGMSVAPMILAPGSRNMILAIYIVIIIMCAFVSEIKLRKKDYRTLLYIVLAIFTACRIDSYAYVLKDAAEIQKDRVDAIQEYKITSRYAKTEDDYVLILPTIEGMAGNVNSVYYKEAIKEYYHLCPQTEILFDDGFVVNNFSLMEKNDGVFEAKIEQYKRYGYTYMYSFSIYKDGILVETKESKSPQINFKGEKESTYRCACTITNLETMQQKIIESDYIFGK